MVSMQFTDILNLADDALRSSAGSAGFRRTGAGKWSRRTGDELHAIWLQKHSSKAAFCVNLGVHYSFLAKAGCTERPSDDKIDQTECRIMLRLTADPVAKDQWWPVTELGIREVMDLFVSRGLAMFDSYRLAGPISSIDVIEIETGTPNLLSDLTKVGASLLLAQIHEHFGHRDKCLEAATCGLKHVGMAVGVRKSLKDILKRLDQPG